MSQAPLYNKRKFSFKNRLQSIGYALQGVKAFFHREHNAVIHLSSTILVVCMAVIFGVTGMEAIALLLVTGFVWTAELFNTAIEKIMDLITVEKRPAVKFIKDVSAAAVLVAAAVALITGAVVFIPKIILLW